MAEFSKKKLSESTGGRGIHVESTQIATATRERSSNVSTITTGVAHGLSTGDVVKIMDVSGSDYNVEFTTITVTSTTAFTYPNTGSDESSAADTSGNVILYTDIHVTVSGTEDFDETWLYANNIGDDNTQLNLLLGGDTIGDLCIQTITSKDGQKILIPGFAFQEGGIIRAVANKESSINVFGWDNFIDN